MFDVAYGVKLYQVVTRGVRMTSLPFCLAPPATVMLHTSWDRSDQIRSLFDYLDISRQINP